MKKNDERAAEVVKAWLEDGTISKEFLSELVNKPQTKAETLIFIPSKKIVTPNKIYPGMFCYSTEDNLIFPEIIPELKDNLASVVSHVIRNEVFSLCRKQKVLPWSRDYLDVRMPKGLSGAENTRLILEAKTKQNKKAEAAQYCADYCLNGVKKNQAFLNSYQELKAAYRNQSVVSKAFTELGEEILEGWLWSSSEYDYSWAWVQSFSDDNEDYSDTKSGSNSVRPGLRFEL